jgi:hypothetical protein
MHKYLKKKLPWYRQWHEQWMTNHAHWLVFACAVLTATWLFSYVAQSAPGQAIVEDIAPAVYAQDVPDQSVVLASPEIVPPIPVVPDRVVK